jgi:hypothetical protein
LAKNMTFRIIVSVVLTIVLLGVSRRTSPRHTQEIAIGFGGVNITHLTVTESKIGQMQTVELNLSGGDVASIQGVLHYNYENESDQSFNMEGQGTGKLTAKLPPGEIGKRLHYRVELLQNGVMDASIPPISEPGYLVKYKGEVSLFVLIPHIFLMFISVFFAFLSAFYGLDLLSGKARMKAAAISVLLALLCGVFGGILIGIKVSHDVFGGSGWGGWPLGNDVTDTKTEFYLLFWLITIILGWGALSGKKIMLSNKGFGWMIMISFIVTLAAFLIPHSISL